MKCAYEVKCDEIRAKAKRDALLVLAQTHTDDPAVVVEPSSAAAKPLSSNEPVSEGVVPDAPSTVTVVQLAKLDAALNAEREHPAAQEFCDKCGSEI